MLDYLPLHTYEQFKVSTPSNFQFLITGFTFTPTSSIQYSLVPLPPLFWYRMCKYYTRSSLNNGSFNPHTTMETHFQHRHSLNNWSSIFCNCLNGTFVIEDCMTAVFSEMISELFATFPTTRSSTDEVNN